MSIWMVEPAPTFKCRGPHSEAARLPCLSQDGLWSVVEALPRLCLVAIGRAKGAQATSMRRSPGCAVALEDVGLSKREGARRPLRQYLGKSDAQDWAEGRSYSHISQCRAYN